MLTITARTTSSLNLRGGPGTNYPVLAVIPNGASVSMQNAQYDGTPTNWYPVQYGGKSGWCSGDYLKSFGVKGAQMKVTELQFLDSFFRHYEEPYIWGKNDCSQYVVDRWQEGGYYPEDGFLDAESDEMFDAIRSGAWDWIPQDPANPAMFSLAFYVQPDSPQNARHVQFVLDHMYGITANGGGRSTVSPKPGAEVKVAPIVYRPDIYVLGGIWLPRYTFKP